MNKTVTIILIIILSLITITLTGTFIILLNSDFKFKDNSNTYFETSFEFYSSPTVLYYNKDLFYKNGYITF